MHKLCISFSHKIIQFINIWLYGYQDYFLSGIQRAAATFKKDKRTGTTGDYNLACMVGHLCCPHTAL